MFANRKEFLEVAAALLTAQRALSLYPPGHPHIKTATDDSVRRLRELLQREQQIPIVLTGDEFIVGDLQVPVEGEAFIELAKALRHTKVEKLIFSEGLRSWEMLSFLRILNLDADDLEAQGGVEAIVETEEIQNIVAGPLHVEASDEPLPDLLIKAWEAYAAGLRVVRKLRRGYQETGRLENLGETKEFVREIVEVGIQQTRPLLALQALKVHDEYSFTHSINVATLSLAIAQGLGFSKFDLHEITLAALLHDIGKERVAGDVLRKPGKLDDSEWAQIAEHSLQGAKMLATTQGVGDLAPIVAYEHHLTQDRSRPDAARWRLHLVSELITIADVYDALRSKRPYRGEISPDKAMDIMREEAAVKFNRVLFDGFSKMVGYYPPGTCVRLDSGEVGIVYQANPDALRQPRVLIVHDAEAQELDTPEQLDLAAEENGSSSAITEVLDAEETGVEPFDYL